MSGAAGYRFRLRRRMAYGEVEMMFLRRCGSMTTSRAIPRCTEPCTIDITVVRIAQRKIRHAGNLMGIRLRLRA
jgi:hypothetical protein